MTKPKTCVAPSQYSSQRQIALVRAWLNSPLTLAAFCEEKCLNSGTFSGWVRRHRAEASRPGKTMRRKSWNPVVCAVPTEVVLLAVSGREDGGDVL